MTAYIGFTETGQRQTALSAQRMCRIPVLQIYICSYYSYVSVSKDTSCLRSPATFTAAEVQYVREIPSGRDENITRQAATVHLHALA